MLGEMQQNESMKAISIMSQAKAEFKSEVSNHGIQ